MRQISVDEWLFRPDSDTLHPVVYEREYEFGVGGEAIKLREIGTDSNGIEARLDILSKEKVVNLVSDGYRDLHQLAYDVEIAELGHIPAFSTLINGQFIFKYQDTDLIIKLQHPEAQYKYSVTYGKNPRIHFYLKDVIEASQTEISKYLVGSYYFVDDYMIYIDFIDEGRGSIINTKSGNVLFDFQMMGMCDFDRYRIFNSVENHTYGKYLKYDHNDHNITSMLGIYNRGMKSLIPSHELVPYTSIEDQETGEISSMYPVPFVFTPRGVQMSSKEHPIYINEYWHPENFTYERHILELEGDELRDMFYKKNGLLKESGIRAEYSDLFGY